MRRRIWFTFCLLTWAVSLSATTRPSEPRPNAADAWSSGDYQYDGTGNIKAIGIDRYAYDTAKRLVAASTENERSGGVARSQEYEYDSFGNRLRSTTTHNDLSRCVNGTLCEENVGIDPRTNRINTNGAQYDVAGNLQSIDTIYRYSYDAVGMMTRQQAPGTTQYIYTPGGERIAVYSAGRWEWSVRDHAGRVLRTFTSTDNAPDLQWTKDYVYRGTVFLATDAPAGRRHYHLDHLGTPRVITDDGGRKLGAHGYHAFGAEVALPFTEQPPERMKFTGHERDITPDIHTLDYMHARYYSPALGRFLSVDPVIDMKMAVSQPQAWNRYAYVRNNPLRWTDPTGKWIDYDDEFRKRVKDDPTFRMAFEAWKKTKSGAEQWKRMSRDTDTKYTLSVAKLYYQPSLMSSREQVNGMTLPLVYSANTTKHGQLNHPWAKAAVNPDRMEESGSQRAQARTIAGALFEEVAHALDIGSGTKTEAGAWEAEKGFHAAPITEPRWIRFQEELLKVLPPEED